MAQALYVSMPTDVKVELTNENINNYFDWDASEITCDEYNNWISSSIENYLYTHSTAKVDIPNFVIEIYHDPDSFYISTISIGGNSIHNKNQSTEEGLFYWKGTVNAGDILEIEVEGDTTLSSVDTYMVFHTLEGTKPTARKCKCMYCEVGGVARKATAAYLSVNGIAELFYGTSTGTESGSTTHTHSYISNGNYTNYNSSLHYYTATCSCGDTKTYYGNHSLYQSSTNGDGSTNWKCYYCNYSETRAADVCSHQYTSEVITAATCTSAGTTIHTCENCGDSYTTNTPEATGHTEYVAQAGKAATCTSTGYTALIKCSVCEETLQERTQIGILGHNYTTKSVDATCTEDAYISRICSNCGYEDTSKRAVSSGTALGHNYVEKITAATCGTQGSINMVCSRCGDSYQTDILPATGDHTWIETPLVGVDGFNIYRCSVCKQTISGAIVDLY